MKNSQDIEWRLALNGLCREQMKCRLLNDIKKDIIVCKLEKWDYKQYLLELVEMILKILERK